MPFDGSGNYSLPEAPFVPGTIISSSAMNSNNDDIADALTTVEQQFLNQVPTYTEGSFTPGFSFGGGTTGIVYTTRRGSYTKQNNLITFTSEVQISSKGSSTGNWLMTGLPFSNLTNSTPPLSVYLNAVNISSSASNQFATVKSGASTIDFWEFFYNAGSSLAVQFDDTWATNSSYIIVSGHYFLF